MSDKSCCNKPECQCDSSNDNCKECCNKQTTTQRTCKCDGNCSCPADPESTCECVIKVAPQPVKTCCSSKKSCCVSKKQ